MLRRERDSGCVKLPLADEVQVNLATHDSTQSRLLRAARIKWEGRMQYVNRNPKVPKGNRKRSEPCSATTKAAYVTSYEQHKDYFAFRSRTSEALEHELEPKCRRAIWYQVHVIGK